MTWLPRLCQPLPASGGFLFTASGTGRLPGGRIGPRRLVTSLARWMMVEK